MTALARWFSCLLAAAKAAKALPVGGQAVIEGVMIKGYQRWAMAVRLQDGRILREHWPLRPFKLWGLARFPVIRGFSTMVEMLREGFRGLSRSTELALGEQEQMTAWDLLVTVVVAALLVLGLFIVLPVWGADRLVGLGLVPAWSGPLMEGLLRAVVFLAYLVLIGCWGDIQRVLAYHGAEHKVINAYEAGGSMAMDQLKAASRIHRRCGTSFLLVVVMVSILVFSLVGDGGLLWRLGSRVLLLPVVVGLSYEIIRAASVSDWGGALMKPALWLQYLTTREPSEDQLAVALQSLEEALDRTFSQEGDDGHRS